MCAMFFSSFLCGISWLYEVLLGFHGFGVFWLAADTKKYFTSSHPHHDIYTFYLTFILKQVKVVLIFPVMEIPH